MDGLTRTLVLALFLLLAADDGGATLPGPEQHSAIEYVPASTLQHYRDDNMIPLAAITSKPFRLCADCTCCAAKDPSSCMTMKCCYGIVCNLPGKPFGVCAFKPLTCDCNNCQ